MNKFLLWCGLSILCCAFVFGVGVESATYRIECNPEIATIQFGGFHHLCEYELKVGSYFGDVAFCFDTKISKAKVIYNNYLDVSDIFKYKSYDMFKGDCYYVEGIRWFEGEVKTLDIWYLPDNISKSPKWDTYFGNVTTNTIDLLLEPLWDLDTYRIGNRDNTEFYFWVTTVNNGYYDYVDGWSGSVWGKVNNSDINVTNGYMTQYYLTNNMTYFFAQNTTSVFEPAGYGTCSFPTGFNLKYNESVNRSIEWIYYKTFISGYCDSAPYSIQIYTRILYSDGTNTTHQADLNGGDSTCRDSDLWIGVNPSKTVSRFEIFLCTNNNNRWGGIYNVSWWFGENQTINTVSLVSNNISLPKLVSSFNLNSNFTGNGYINISFDGTIWNYLNLSNNSLINLTDDIFDNNILSYKISLIRGNSSPITQNLSTYTSFKYTDTYACPINQTDKGNGIIVIPQYNLRLTNVTVYHNVTGKTFRILLNSTKTLLYELNRTGINASGNPYWETDYNLTGGIVYLLLITNYSVNSNRSYTATAAPSLPRNTDLISIDMGWNGDSAGSCTQTGLNPYIFNFYTLTMTNFSGSSTLYNFTIDFSGLNNNVLVNMYNEVTMSLINSFSNITLTSLDNPFILKKNTTTGSVNFSDLNVDNYELRGEHDNYTTRRMYFDVNNGVNDIINMYLLPKSISENVSMCFYDANGVVLEDLLVSMWVLVNGSYNLVANEYSNVQGRVYFNFNPISYYKFNYTKSGYSSDSFILNPVRNDVTLSSGCNYDITIFGSNVYDYYYTANVTGNAVFSNVTKFLVFSYVSSDFSFVNVSYSVSKVVDGLPFVICSGSNSSVSSSFSCDLTGYTGVVYVQGVFNDDRVFYGTYIDVGYTKFSDILDYKDVSLISGIVMLIIVLAGITFGVFGVLVSGVSGLFVIYLLRMLSPITLGLVIVDVVVVLVIASIIRGDK